LKPHHLLSFEFEPPRGQHPGQPPSTNTRAGRGSLDPDHITRGQLMRRPRQLLLKQLQRAVALGQRQALHPYRPTLEHQIKPATGRQARPATPVDPTTTRARDPPPTRPPAPPPPHPHPPAAPQPLTPTPKITHHRRRVPPPRPHMPQPRPHPRPRQQA